jgi:hypothetical protein
MILPIIIGVAMPHRRRRRVPRIRRTGATTHPLPRPMRISPHHVTDGRRRLPIATTGWKIAGDQRAAAITTTTVTTIMKPPRRSAGSVAAAAGGKAIGERIRRRRRNVIVMRRGSSDPLIDGRRRRQSGGGRPNITNDRRRPLPPVVLGIQTGIRVMSRGRAVISSDAELTNFFWWRGGRA